MDSALLERLSINITVILLLQVCAVPAPWVATKALGTSLGLQLGWSNTGVVTNG
jgi:hypothetical protein